MFSGMTAASSRFTARMAPRRAVRRGPPPRSLRAEAVTPGDVHIGFPHFDWERAPST